MSNIFKINSRFASLIDDNFPPQKNNNKKKIDEGRSLENNFNSFKSERKSENFRELNEIEREKRRIEKEKQDKIKKERDEREKEIKTKELLNINNFPELVVIKNNEVNNEVRMNYLEKIKTEQKKDIIIDPDLVNLKPGWLLIKKNKITGEIIMKSHPDYNNDIFVKREKTDKEIANDIINSLVKLHEKRTQEYIELNGYDTWEKMFKFPNWQEENYSDSEYEYDDEDEDEYCDEDEYYN